jgi:hypothetical protein
MPMSSELFLAFHVFRWKYYTRFSSLPSMLRIPRVVLLITITVRGAELQYHHHHHPWLYSPLLGSGRFFSFVILYTFGRTPWTGDQPVARLLPTHRTAQTQNKRTQTSMPRVGFKPTATVFERAKTIYSLNCADTMIGEIQDSNYCSRCYVSELKKMLRETRRTGWSLHTHFSRLCDLCSLGLDTVRQPPWIDPNYGNAALHCSGARPLTRNFCSELWIRSVFLGREVPMPAAKRTKIFLWWPCETHVQFHSNLVMPATMNANEIKKIRASHVNTIRTRS